MLVSLCLFFSFNTRCLLHHCLVILAIVLLHIQCALFSDNLTPMKQLHFINAPPHFLVAFPPLNALFCVSGTPCHSLFLTAARPAARERPCRRGLLMRRETMAWARDEGRVGTRGQRRGAKGPTWSVSDRETHLAPRRDRAGPEPAQNRCGSRLETLEPCPQGLTKIHASTPKA